ncbi:MAG TPA: DUF4442 domain-containing protein [Cytophagaceae bacterium]|nr:DUF4442 domain-containing protein [Cytophagaceae bacterium]
MKKIYSTLRHPVKLKLFMLRKLPMGLLAGLKIEELDEQKAVVSIRYKYLTQNPFHSIYFACLAMAGELASGALGIACVYESTPRVSMLVIGMEASFTKKAVGKIKFTCQDGVAISKAIEESKSTGEGRTVVATSVGTDEAGDQVAVFRITWSYKAKV